MHFRYIISTGASSAIRDLLILILSAIMVKYEVLATLKCSCDLNAKRVRYQIYMSSGKITMLLYLTFSGKFED